MERPRDRTRQTWRCPLVVDLIRYPKEGRASPLTARCVCGMVGGMGHIRDVDSDMGHPASDGVAGSAPSELSPIGSMRGLPPARQAMNELRRSTVLTRRAADSARPDGVVIAPDEWPWLEEAGPSGSSTLLP